MRNIKRADENRDIRRGLLAAFGDNPKQLKKVLKELQRLIPDMEEVCEERMADYYMGRGPHPGA